MLVLYDREGSGFDGRHCTGEYVRVESVLVRKAGWGSLVEGIGFTTCGAVNVVAGARSVAE